MPYIYQADLWCDSCGRAIQVRLGTPYRHKQGGYLTPGVETDADPDTNKDSDTYPQYVPETGPSDSPSHCGAGPECLEAETLLDGTKVGAILDTELTEDGAKYVKDAILRGGPVTPLWAETFADYLTWTPEDFTGWSFAFLGIFTGNETWELEQGLIPDYGFRDLIRDWRSLGEVPELCEVGDSDYQYCAKEGSGDSFYEALQDFQVNDLWPYERFKEVFDRLCLAAEDVQTMGTLGGDANPGGWAPDISLTLDSQWIISTIRVTPMPPEGWDVTRMDWDTVRAAFMQAWEG